jgi:hypothetical protein
VVLEDHPDRPLGRPAPHPLARILQHVPGELDAPPVDGLEPGQRPEQRGLPGPVGTHERHDLTRRDGQPHLEIQGTETERDMRFEAHGDAPR